MWETVVGIGVVVGLLVGAIQLFKWLRPSFAKPAPPEQPKPPRTDVITMTPQQFAQTQREMLTQTKAELEKAHGAERQQLQDKIDELNRRLANPEEALAQQHAKILDLEARLERLGNRIGGDRLAAARDALRAGEFTLANDIFAEVDAARELDVQEAASAAFGLGEVAEVQIRWADAATHYDKAARLNPTFDALNKAREFAWRSGDYPAALRHGQDLLKQAHTLDDQEKLSLALNEHALTLKATGRFDAAEPLYREALKITRELQGTAHPDYATDLNNLALLLQDTGRLDEAEPLFREALEITRQVHGTAHPDYAIDLNNLAGLLGDTGRLDEAEPLFREALEINRQVHGTAHPDYARGLNNLAGLLHDTGRFDEAEPLYREALEIDRQVHGTAHPDYAIRLNNLAGLLRDTGRFDEAEPLCREALEIDRQVHGTAHPDYAIRLNNLAGLLRDTGRFDEAEPLFREAVQIFETSLGPDHPSTQTVRKNLATLLAEKSDQKL